MGATKRLFLIVLSMLLFVLLFASVSSAQNKPFIDGLIRDTEYDGVFNFANGDYKLYLSIIGDEAYFGIAGKTNGWVAVGLEPTSKMKDADMVFGLVDANGQVKVIDAFSIDDYGPHPEDETLGGTNDILEKRGTEVAGTTYIEFKRKLSTGDKYDKIISSSGKLNIIWAMGSEDSFTSPHISRGYGEINLTSQTAKENSKFKLWQGHAIIMVTAFVLFALGALFAFALRKVKDWFKFHLVLAVSGSTLILAGIFFAYYMVSVYQRSHFAFTHAYTGIIAFTLAIVTIALGVSSKKAKAPLKKNLRNIHKLFAALAIISLIVAIALGILRSKLL